MRDVAERIIWFIQSLDLEFSSLPDLISDQLTHFFKSRAPNSDNQAVPWATQDTLKGPQVILGLLNPCSSKKHCIWTSESEFPGAAALSGHLKHHCFSLMSICNYVRQSDTVLHENSYLTMKVKPLLYSLLSGDTSKII